MLRLYSIIFASTIILGLTYAEARSSHSHSAPPARVNSYTSCGTRNSSCGQENATCGCNQVYTFRLTPGTEVLTQIEYLVQSMNLQAVTIIHGIGSLSAATFRFVGRSDVADGKEKTYDENLALNNLDGSFSTTWSHLHAVVSRYNGETISAGVVSLTVATTVEVALLENCQEVYFPDYDNTVGSQVLGVRER